MLAAAHEENIIIEQADVKNAYLNAWMHDDEIVLMDPPELYTTSCEIPKHFHKLIHDGQKVVLHLKRPLYNTKEGAHQWYEELKKTLLKLYFKVSHADKATFYKVQGEEFIVLAAATNDFTIITNSRMLSTKTKAQLNGHFELVDLGNINWLLGVSVTRNLTDKTITLGQQSYIELILTRFGLTDARPAFIPMEPQADYHLDSPSVSMTSHQLIKQPTMK